MLMRGLVALAALLLIAAAHPDDEPPPVCTGLHLIGFESGSASLSPPARGKLDGFISLLAKGRAPSRVEVQAHADRAGSRRSNLLLSWRRARAVRDYLVAKGTDRSRITLAANGEDKPLVETEDGVSDIQNRTALVIEHVAPAEWARRLAWRAKHGRPAEVC